ncbi:carbohydrate esterase [Streptomyces sp. 3MP-14]|uniref:Carbohydrate esterase n=2 Tax=Streptomyces TaxID=1883 RepID=A0A5N6ACV3_9ACTN|nr:carbohydrate esterase [Streptomyces mimosae]KAB8176282.1 carbohydrate esterase [Streptomyces sp. 3MP-14]
MFVGLVGTPARAEGRPGGTPPGTCTGEAPVLCHYDVAPGSYRVTVTLGGDEAGSTSVQAETRRTVLGETPTGPGEVVRRSFTVDVRTPEGEPTGPDGSPGLDLRVGGDNPRLLDLRVTPASRTRQILLVGDSTVCDQASDPYSGWGQQLPQFLRQQVVVANYAASGEGTGSVLAKPELFDAVEARVRPGDLVLVQLGHNDKSTPAEEFRANLATMVERVTARGGEPVLVTPIVRRRFQSDGALDPVALHVMGGGDLPAAMRSLADDLDVPLIDLTDLTRQLVEDLGTEESKDLYLTNVNGDNTHTSVHGATVYARLVLDQLRDQRLISARATR